MTFERVDKIEVERAIKIIEKFEREGHIDVKTAENIIYELYEEASIDRYHRPR